MGAVIGPPGEAMEELDSPYHHCCAVVLVELKGCLVQLKYRHEAVAQGGSGEKVLGDVVMPIFELEVCQFWPFPLSSTFANYHIVL